MDDNDLIVCILGGLGSEFDPIVTTLNARDMFPREGMISKLRDFEIKLYNAKTTPSNVAFYTNRNRSHIKSQGSSNMRGCFDGYSKMQFQGHNKDVYNSRYVDNSSKTQLSSFIRPGRSSGHRRRGITCFCYSGLS